ncbi:TPA: hypothetical protein DCQ44_02020 [Candidatus Taylorbacteria bacterium]|nr:hypothetical protein [Candidatus Taylorbacteria bacterium]
MQVPCFDQICNIVQPLTLCYFNVNLLPEHRYLQLQGGTPLESEELTQNEKTAEELIVLMEEMDLAIFPDKPLEVLAYYKHNAPTETMIGLGRGYRVEDDITTADKTFFYWILIDKIFDLMGMVWMYDSHLINNKIVHKSKRTMSDRQIGIAAHEVRHRCQLELKGLVMLDRCNIHLFPELQPKVDFCLQIEYNDSELSAEHFDALMVEECVLQMVESHDSLTPELFDKIIQIVSARNPAELKQLLK